MIISGIIQWFLGCVIALLFIAGGIFVVGGVIKTVETIKKYRRLRNERLADGSISDMLTEWSNQVNAPRPKTDKRLFTLNYLLQEGFIYVMPVCKEDRIVYEIYVNKDTPNDVEVQPVPSDDSVAKMVNIDSGETTIITDEFFKKHCPKDIRS